MEPRISHVVTTAELRAQLAPKNKWISILHNPKLVFIAFFAS